MRLQPLLYSCSLALATIAAAQSPAPGFRLYGTMLGNDTHLVDTTGRTVHTWSGQSRPGLGVYLLEDGSLLRTIRTRSIPGVSGVGGRVQRIAFDGTVLWDYRYDTPTMISHHDIAPMPNGNVLMIAWEDKLTLEATEAGRQPGLISTSVFRVDHVIEVQPTGPTSGTIVWQWHVWDHVVQEFDASKGNYGVVADHPELIDINYPPDATQANDWNHVNGIDYDPIHDWVVLSSRRQNEIWIIDHSTTTAEAVGSTGGRYGKGGDLLYRWGNPAVYKRGTAADQRLYGQHAPTFIPPGRPGAGHLMLFNNLLPSGAEAWEVVLPADAQGRFPALSPGGTYGPADPFWTAKSPVVSNIVSNAERLPNGNTLICAGQRGRIVEVTPEGQQVWSVSVGEGVFHAHYVDRSLWADAVTLPLTTGGSVGFDLVAGSEHAGQAYLVLGSASGTSPGFAIHGQALPLNPDSYFMLSLSSAGVYPFLQTFGVLDQSGRASAGFGLPAGLTALVGLHLDHAYVVVDPVSGRVTRASNAVPLDLTR